MKILLLGANGQLAKTIKETKPKDIDLISFSSSEFNFLDMQRSIKNLENINPTHIINAAAYTNVDKAESEKELAERINAYAPFEIASSAASLECKFIQISTDFVFNGSQSQKLPGVISISFLGFRSDILLIQLDREEIYVSNGSACGSGIVKPSHVLSAIGLDESTNLSTLRFSFGNNNSLDEIKTLINILKNKILK